MYLRLLETLLKHGLVFAFEIFFCLGKISWDMKRNSPAGTLLWSSWFVRLWGRQSLLHLSLELIRLGLEYKYILCDWTNTFSSPRSPTPNTVHPYVSAEDSCFFCSSLTYSCGGVRRFHFTDDFTCFPYSWHNWFWDFFVTSHQFLNLSQMIFTIVGREPWDRYVSWMPSKIVFLLTSIGAFLLPSIGALTTMPTCQTHCFSFGSSLLCFDKLKCSSASKKSVRNKLFQLCIVRSFCSEGWEALFVIRTNLLSIASINCHLSLICDLILNFAAVLEHHCVKFTKFSE